MTMNEVEPPMNAIPQASRPQVAMIRVIQIRAPNRSKARLLGTSSRK